jgi:hypothetical protein
VCVDSRKRLPELVDRIAFFRMGQATPQRREGNAFDAPGHLPREVFVGTGVEHLWVGHCRRKRPGHRRLAGEALTVASPADAHDGRPDAPGIVGITWQQFGRRCRRQSDRLQHAGKPGLPRVVNTHKPGLPGPRRKTK